MASFKKALAKVTAGASLAAVSALGMAPAASAASWWVTAPNADTVVVVNKGNAAVKTPVKRAVYAVAKKGNYYAWSYAWTTDNRCSIAAFATVKPVPAYGWVTCYNLR